MSEQNNSPSVSRTFLLPMPADDIDLIKARPGYSPAFGGPTLVAPFDSATYNTKDDRSLRPTRITWQTGGDIKFRWEVSRDAETGDPVYFDDTWTRAAGQVHEFKTGPKYIVVADTDCEFTLGWE